MRKYIKPEISIELLEIEDLITTSGEVGESSARMLKTKVNGNEGTNYGSQEISVFD